MTETPIRGMGHSVKRKEDARFLRGKGHYIDDFKLPGMLYMDIVRSPYAHAMIKNIDASKALALPGVLAVITGKDLEAAGLAWMPTLMSDKQMVLPVDRVVYQAQEVAAVIATERYIAADAIALIEVDYEPLEPVIDPFKAHAARVAAGAPRPRGQDQPHLALGGRRRRGDRRALRYRRCDRQAGPLYPAHPRLQHRDLRLHRVLGPDRRASSPST